MRNFEPQPLTLPSQTIALGDPSVPVLSPLGLTVLIASLFFIALIRRKHQSRSV